MKLVTTTRIKKYDENKFNAFKAKKEKLYLLDEEQLTTFDIIRLMISYVALLLWALIIIFPVSSLVLASFNTYNPRYVSVSPLVLGLDNFKYIFESERSRFGSWYLNTIIIAISTMIISTIFVAFSGYAYSRFKFFGSRSSLAATMLIQMIPATASLISLFIIVKMGTSVGIDSRAMLIIIYSGGSIAGNTFVLKGYLGGLSTELDDAAKIDGCGNWKLFMRIIFPIARPMLAIIALWSFLGPFNDVLLPKYVIFDIEKYTLPIGLDTFLNAEPKHINAGAYSAGALLASLPPLFLFMYLQRFIVGELFAGAVK